MLPTFEVCGPLTKLSVPLLTFLHAKLSFSRVSETMIARW